MHIASNKFSLSASAFAVALLVSACGGGDPVAPADNVPPTVTITDSEAGATATGPVTFTFTFSEDTGDSFTAEDVVVTGGTAGTFTRVSGTVATLVVTPTANASGTIMVTVPAGKFADLSLNANVGSASGSQAYDTVVVVPPPVGGDDVVLASFDEATPLVFEGFNGAESSAIAAGPAGGTGLAAKIIRLGGEVWAGAKVNVGVIPLTATNHTISARVYSDIAGVPMVLKLENATNPDVNTGDMQSTQAVVAGWQTLTWVVPADKVGPEYSWVVMLPNLGTLASVDPGETYYFDDIKLVVAAPPTDAVLASFDEATPLVFEGFNGAESSAIAAGPAGGTGLAAKIIRLGGEVWAGAKVNVGVIPLTATNHTISARVYSDIAGVPMVLKLENATDPGVNTGDMAATQAVVAGWQTLTWVVPADKVGPSYSWVVMLPNLGTKASVDPGETYYFDDIKLVGGGAGGGGGGGGGGGSGFVGGVYADDYVGDLFVNSKSTQGGDVGFFYDQRLVDTKAYDYAGVSGTAQDPQGVHNFYFGFGLNPPAITDAYFGAYVKSPGNATVDVSTYTSIKVNVWGPDQLFKAGSFPTLKVTLQGPAVGGCTGSEVAATFSTTQQGAASVYTVPLANFAITTACSGETTVAQVLASVAQVNVLLLNTNIQYVNKDPNGVAFTNGLNIGSIKFN